MGLYYYYFFFFGGGGVAKIKKLYACYSLYFFVDNIGCWVQAYVLRKTNESTPLGLARVARKPVFGVCSQERLKPELLTTETSSTIFQFLNVAR